MDSTPGFLELLLPLFQAGRHDAVCDALVSVMHTRGALTLGELVLLGMSARAAGRTEIVAWCGETVKDLCETEGLEDEARALAAEFVKITTRVAGAAVPSRDLLGLRLSVAQGELQ